MKWFMLILVSMLVMSSGCNIADMMLDASYDAMKTWGKENFPVLKSDLGNFVLEEVGKAKDEVKAYAREKTEDAKNALAAKIEARSGVPAPEYKAGDSVSDAFKEMKRWWADTQLENERRRLENERREKEGKEPGEKPMGKLEMLLYGLGGLAALGGGYAVKKRGEKDQIDRRITGYLRNVGLVAPDQPVEPKKK